jgi:hypothetical protein
VGGESGRAEIRTDLSRFFPYFSVLSTEDLGVEKAIALSWCRFCIGLTADLYSLTLREVDVFGDEGIVERV